MIQLYPDQNVLLEKTRSSIRAGNKSVLMQAATGAGKTQISAKMIANSQVKGAKSIFIVPRKELRKQTSETLIDNNIMHSFVSSGMPFNPHAQTFVATAATLANRLDTVPDMKLVVCDEIHHAGDGMDKIINFYKQRGAVVVGLSATPVKLSGKGLDCWFGDMVCGESIKWLIDNKRLANYRLFSPDTPDLTGIKTDAQIADKMENERVLIGSAVNHYKTHAMGKLGVTYTTSRKHSEIVAEQFRNAGIPAMNIDGTMDDAERSRIIKAFARRELLQLVNCELLCFGFDLASAAKMDVTIETLTDLQPTQSLAKQMQKWGRVLRYKDFPALIFDHSGNCVDYKGEVKHGLPSDDREWSLRGIDKKARDAAEKAIPVFQCPKCYWCCRKPNDRTCPNCGYTQPVQERKIEQRDGELQEIDIEAMAQKKKIADKIEVWNCRSLEDFKRLEIQRGYKKGWSRIQYEISRKRKRAAV